MFIKCLNGDNYINSTQIYGLFVDVGPENTDPHYYVKAGVDAACSVVYVLEGYDTKEAAELALVCLVDKLNGQQDVPAPTPDVAAPNKPKTELGSAKFLACNLDYFVDEFARSGDSDYLLRINAYIRAYLEQEG